MLQWSVVLIVAELADGTPGWWLSAAAIVALAFVSLASARWIEAPTRRLLRGTARTRRAVPLASAPS